LVTACATQRLQWLPATVEAREFQGEFTRYRVRVGTQSLSVDEAHRAGDARHAVGTRCTWGWMPSQVRLLAA
jgi:iron(III) transport system ATP-binding protein